MAAFLSRLSNGHYSLEFEPADLPRVAEAIRNRYSTLQKRHHLSWAECNFGGCSLLFENDWDDPCLISGSSEGDVILKLLCEDLGSAS